MKLVVETGQGTPDANSYLTNSEALDGLPSAVSSVWVKLSMDEQIDRLAAASLFIDTSFAWAGRQKTLEQGLSWPREDVFFEGMEVADNAIPRQIKKAVIMALQIIDREGLLVFQSDTEQKVKKEKLGAMETEYFPPGKGWYDHKSDYDDINNLLKGFYTEIKNKGGVITAEVLRA